MVKVQSVAVVNEGPLYPSMMMPKCRNLGVKSLDKSEEIQAHPQLWKVNLFQPNLLYGAIVVG